MVKSKQLLEQALRSLPNDFSFRDVRIYMTRALVEYGKVEEKKKKKNEENTPHNKWKLDLKTGSIMAPPLTPKQKVDVLSQIDALINLEQQKLEDAKKKKSPNKDDDIILD